MADNNTDQAGEAQGGDAQDGSFGEVATREDVATQDDQGAGTGETQDQGTGADDTGNQGGDGQDAQATDTGVGKPELTEKGTKLDPNPQSAVHQELANAKRDKANMEAVLGDPEKLARFMEVQYGIKAQVPAKAGEAAPNAPKVYTAADFETLDNVAEVVNGLQQKFSDELTTVKTENEQLKKQVGGLLMGGRAQQIYTASSEGAAALKSEPELDPKSPSYIPGLEEDIVAEYQKLDFDEVNGTYRGTHTLKEVGDRVIAIARKSRAKGSQDAQTVIKDRSAGKVRTSPGVTEKDGGDTLPPESSIAEGIRKLGLRA